MKLDAALYVHILLLFACISFLPRANGLVQSQPKKRPIIPSNTKKHDKPSLAEEPTQIDSKIVPFSKGSRNVLFGVVRLSSKAALAAVKITKGTLKSSVDLIAGDLISGKK